MGLAVLGMAARPDKDILFADFEGKDYGAWVATGEAFGSGPAQGTLPNQMLVSGFRGKGLVNSFNKGDATTGTLTSPEFTIGRPFINFLIGGGDHVGETCINLLVAGRTLRTTTGPNNERLDWRSWNVRDLIGKTAQIQIVDNNTGGWGHINVDEITQSDTRQAVEIKTEPLYEETYRPQFHFTAQKNWLNDPNGLVYYKGDFHLFFQHNPQSVQWGNMTWGHAISRDMVHWKQQPHAIEPDSLGTIFSGSAVVDWNNTGGFQQGKEKTLAAFYTAAGKPFTQCLAYSTDSGRTWIKYAGNPVLPNINGENRDPKVIWHAPSKKWVMALYVRKGESDGIEFFGSPDLKKWSFLSRIEDYFECPDIFELPVEGRPGETHWIVLGANSHYSIGQFDGTTFTKESGKFVGDYGANFYASQTYSDIPASDGRRIQIGWMNGGSYPQMPFNQQMSFPCTLTLRSFPDGLRVVRQPIKELDTLHGKAQNWNDLALKPGDNPLAGLSGDLFDIQAEIEPGEAETVGFRLRGEEVRYSTKDKILTSLGKSAPLEMVDGRLRLRILVDRASLEIFGNDGRVSMTSCFLPAPSNKKLELYAVGGAAKVLSLKVYPLRSAWK